MGTANNATVTIADNDKPTITISATDANAAETLTGETANPGVFTLTRTGSTSAALTVSYTMAGTATNSTDYTNLNGSVTFAAGSSTALVNINPIDDQVYENTESVILTLSTNSNYNIGATNIATVIIADNEFDNAGNSLSQSRLITGGSQQFFSDFIDSQDIDFYQFIPNALSDLTINFSGLTDDAHVELLRSDGSLINSTGLYFPYGATTNGQTASPLNALVAAGQTYYLRVYGDNLYGTAYNLRMSLNPLYFS